MFTSAKSKNPLTSMWNERSVVGLKDWLFELSITLISRKYEISVHDVICPFYIVGDVNQANVTTIGEGNADVWMDDVLAAGHALKIILDNTIPVNISIGRTYMV